MNQSKFSLADVIMLLVAIAFGFVCFLSTFFCTLGDITQSLILAAIVTMLLFGTAFGAKLLKRTSRHFKKCFVLEVILLILFTGFTTFFAYSPFSHYFVVSDQKMEIQNKLTVSIMQAENMFAEYERYAENREALYKSKLQSTVRGKNVNPGQYKELGFEKNSITDGKQIENKMFTMHADLFPTNYSDMSNGFSNWLTGAKNTASNWRPIDVVNVVNNVEKNSNDWLNTLIELSKVRQRGEGEQTEDFTFNLSFDDIKKYFTTLGSPTPLSIGLSVAAYFLMLLSYWRTKRHPRWPGVKIVFGCGRDIIDNEL